MKLLYLDCGMGAAGDMLTAALLELFPNREEVVKELNGIGIPGVRYELETTQKCGITGSRMRVLVGQEEEGEHPHHPDSHDHTHSHSTLASIDHMISHLNLSQWASNQVRQVYRSIAAAESKVHAEPVEQIHFHEVGSMDALADVSAVCYLMEKLSPDRVEASPVHVGSGRVSCAHGILPVPAPATAELLKGIPVYGGSITGELCTPTGAALLRQFVSSFGSMPVMTLDAVGYGMGKKDFAVANCLRALLGHGAEGEDTVVELRCNLDDMTGEEIGFATEQLMAEGALDVFTTPIGMKKNRPGILLTVLCKPEHRETMVRQLFRCTTTLGIREESCRRYTLERRTETTETPWGTLRRKVASGYGAERQKPEYEDLARIARQNHTQWPLRNGANMRPHEPETISEDL